MQHRLWYRSFTDKFIAGLPMGNGRLALMAVGGPGRLRLAVNHEWMWRRRTDPRGRRTRHPLQTPLKRKN